MRCFIVRIVFLCFCGLNGVSAMAQANDGSVETQVGSIALLRIPIGSQLSRDHNVAPDFGLYYVTLNQRIILGVYYGNAPDFVGNGGTTRIMIGDCAAEAVLSMNDGNYNRDILMKLDDTKDFPQYMHLFYRNLDHQNAETADRMIDTIRLLQGRRCKA